MKMTKYMAALCLPLLALTACETDREMATFDSTTATPATLSINGTAQDLYTLDASNASVNVFTIDWSKPNFGLQVPVTNVLQMDIDGKNFSNAQVLTTETDVKITSYAVIASNLNANIQTLLNAYGMETPTTPEEAVTLNFRLASFITGSASDSLFSEVLNVRVLPYEGEAIYPSLDVVGIDGNWDFATSQKIYSLESNDTYSGMVYFNSLPDGGWKLAASSWDSDKNWGGDVEAEASTATLTPAEVTSRHTAIRAITSHSTGQRLYWKCRRHAITGESSESTTNGEQAMTSTWHSDKKPMRADRHNTI